MPQADLFSVFEEDEDDQNTISRESDFNIKSIGVGSKRIMDVDISSPNKRQKTIQEMKEEKPLILEVAEGTAAAEKRKQEENQETTLIECIHEVAYPPNWRKYTYKSKMNDQSKTLY